MSGNADRNNGHDALNNTHQAGVEGANDLVTPLIGRDWDEVPGTSINRELIADEDIPESSIGSPLISTNQGLYNNISLSGSTIVLSEATDSTITQNDCSTESDGSPYGTDMTDGQILPGRAHTPPHLEWIIGTCPRQYRPIHPLPDSDGDEDSVFVTAPNSPDIEDMDLLEFIKYLENRYPDTPEDCSDTQDPDVPEDRTETPPPEDRMITIAFIGKDVRAATGSMIPQLDASGRPTHFVNGNGIPYASGIFMFQSCILNITKCIRQNQYRHSQHALYEFCTLYTNAVSMTKYKQVHTQVAARKEKDESGYMSISQDDVVHDCIQDHVQESLWLAEAAYDFLESTPFVKNGADKVEDALVEGLQVLKIAVEKVKVMETTWRNWKEIEPLLQEMAQAVYELGIVCKGLL
ncbi:hypothetical protein FKW77_010705 [Venturia effusa]|uniref:Uncharacterized protein n=1 Tax=Venturia effusa TaxID=50376 RepID=A0A517KY74_9PEZI|nr:hypothetical protein FKW77_010705 [Venturia effusa]